MSFFKISDFLILSIKMVLVDILKINNNRKMSKSSNNNNSPKVKVSPKEEEEEKVQIPLSEISCPIERKKEEIKRKREEEDKELESFILEEENRKERVNKIQDFVNSKEVKSLFPEIESPSDMVKEMISVLKIQDEIKEFFFSSLKESPKGRGRGNEVKLRSRDVLLYKIYKMENPSVGDGSLSQNILPSLSDFPKVCYSKGKNIRSGVYDHLLNDEDKELLESFNGLGDILGMSPIPSGNFQKIV